MNIDEFFKELKCFCPISIYEKIKEKSKELGVPMSNLLIYALDNELDSPAPFNYPALLPSTIFIENAYVEEAQKIATFLNKNPKGMPRAVLLASRRSMGIDSREAFLAGLRELYEANVIEEFRPKDLQHYIHPPNTKYLRMKNLTGEKREDTKKREIERQLKKIKEREKRLLEQLQENTK
jgi:hypothetical protein